jgi:uncharacterized zinc-type alcohol dehydrogenase-like protein
MTTSAQAQQTEAPVEKGPFSVRALGATSATSPMGPLQIPRRVVGPTDVLMDVLYCAICHTNIHYARNEWGSTRYSCIPGHEIIGRVEAIGRAVTKFKVGDIAGVGTIVDSDRTCENCLADREQNCLSGVTFTYNSPHRVSGGIPSAAIPTRLSSPSISPSASRRARTSRRPHRCCAPASPPSRRCSTGS